METTLRRRRRFPGIPWILWVLAFVTMAVADLVTVPTGLPTSTGPASTGPVEAESRPTSRR